MAKVGARGDGGNVGVVQMGGLCSNLAAATPGVLGFGQGPCLPRAVLSILRCRKGLTLGGVKSDVGGCLGCWVTEKSLRWGSYGSEAGPRICLCSKSPRWGQLCGCHLLTNSSFKQFTQAANY